MRFLIAQIIGLAAMAFCVGCFLCKDSRRLLIIQMAGNALFILQFILLDAYSGVMGVVVLVLSSLIQVLRMQGHRWASKVGWRWGFFAASVLSGLATWADWFSILPCIGNIAFIQSNRTGDTRIIRLWKLLAVGPCWIIYNLHVRSYFGAVSETIGICVAAGALLYAKKHTGTSHPELTQEEHHGDI